MRNAFKVVAALTIVALAVCGIVVLQQPKVDEEPARGMAPAGYEEYASGVDPEFCKTVASQLAALGDDPALGFRGAGSPAEAQAADLLEQTMKDIGLENVTVDEVDSDGWTFGGANITFKDSDGAVRTATLGGYQTNITAENERIAIVYLGKGAAADYEGVDMTGKLALIDIDQENEWRINFPAYQARLKGARAVVACSHLEGENAARIVSQNICGDADAPALAISAEDSQIIRDAIEANGYEAGGARQIDVLLNANSEVERNKGTRNLWGEIPGETDEAILFIAHYDGYYHSFYDDASGVGMVLGIAKALREGGVKPEKTFRFVLHGAGEWGRSGTEADWATGAYEQIVNVRPEWARQAFALFNIDSGYPLDSTRGFNISVPTELGDFARTAVASFGDRSEIKVTPNIAPPSSSREDFIYNAYGVPTLATEGGEGDEQYFASMYHSNMDDLAVGGYSVAGVLGMGRFIGYSALMLDETPLRPLKFMDRFETLKSTLTDQPDPVYDAHLMANLDRAIESAQALDDFITGFNAEYRLSLLEVEGENGENGVAGDEAEQTPEDMRKLAEDINDSIYAVYRDTQDELLRLDRNFETGFANEGIQRNVVLLRGARDALMDNDPDSAVYSYLSKIESVYAATAFDAATCDKIFKGSDDFVEDTWAEGKLVSRACRADGVVRAVLKKMDSESADALYGESSATASAVTASAVADAEEETENADDTLSSFAGEIQMIDYLIGNQEDMLRAVYNGQEDALARLTESMNELIDTYASDSRTENVGV
ncbi:MAG: M28 family peptidase [Clostridiales Family XIII bacterium]|jgi:hypothetical protein|nr:M28 family peptidase [Clostridiales Family XIII bacterium]